MKTFVSHDIRGSELLHLERRDLKVREERLIFRFKFAPEYSTSQELGVTKVGHLKRLQQAIRDLVLRIGESSTT